MKEYERRLSLASEDEKRYLFVEDYNIQARTLAPGLLWLLLDMRSQYLGDGKRRPNIRDSYPKTVIEKKRLYAADNDITGSFVTEMYTRDGTNPETDFLNFTEVKRYFNSWYINNARGFVKPKAAEVGKGLEASFRGPVQKLPLDAGYGWKGWKLK